MIKFNVEQSLLPKESQISPIFIEKLANVLFGECGASGTIALTMVDDEEIKRLNRMYREKDEVTDVLSFGYGEGDFLGDIAISWPQVQRQADGDVELELTDLIIHGCLHVLGFDHKKAEEAQEMFSMQDKILKQIL